MSLRPYIGLSLLIFIIAIPIFAHLDASPIILWDESRLANNAIEMVHYNNNWLVPTMDGVPDMWNTKPPLMIWLQVLMIKMLGVNELAIRIPSALAALGTCLIIFFFFARKYKEPLLGLVSAAVLITSGGYVSIHGIRTGDYDAMLTFFITGYTISYFLYLNENKRKYLYATFIFLVLASLTKGIQGLIVLPALLIYTFYKKKIIFILKQKDIYIGIAAFIVFVVGYYLMREHYNPGYIASVEKNELGGRFNTVIETHEGEWDYYYNLLMDTYFHPWYLLVIPGIVLGLLNKNKAIKEITAFSVIVAFSYLLIISLASTKIDWYLLPMYPFLAIIVGIFLFSIYKILASLENWKQFISYNALPYIFLFSVFLFPYQSICNAVLTKTNDPGTAGSRTEFKQFLKDVLHHNRNVGNCALLNDDFQQDFFWYYKEFQFENYSITIVNKSDIDPYGKVAAYTPDSKKYIEENYNATIFQSENSVIVYSLSGRRNIGASEK